jgi:hypothetical protein
MLSGSNDTEKLEALCKKKYKDQTIWFLNAYWHKLGEAGAENLWNFAHKASSLDLQKNADGCEMDEFNAHKFLEHFKQTMTVREMRDTLRDTGVVKGQIKMFPLIFFLIAINKSDWHELVNAAQGDNKEEIEMAQKKLNDVQVAFTAAQERSKQAHEALELSKKREIEAKAAQAELEAALADLKAQEDAYNNKTQELKTKSEDESSGVVQRNKSKNLLAQHLAEDPLPLRRSKINQEAAVKKADKATKDAADAKEASEKAKLASEKALDEMTAKVEEAEAFLNEVRSKPGSAQGALWYMDRELHEARAYLPEKKGGYRKK